MRKLLLTLSFTLAVFVMVGQDNNFNRSPVTLPSPDAAQFIRYGDIPIDYSTGVPNISIPIYKLTSGKLSLPIDISYNASGIKVLDIAGTVGLGWSLNAGGLVSRTVMGADDQLAKPKPFLTTNDISNALNAGMTNLTNAQNFVETVSQTFQLFNETQSDRYFYSINGRSGFFRLDFQTGIPKTIPYSALKISVGPNNSGPYKITTEDGVSYYFEKGEMSGSVPGNVYYTSFYLTKIESPDRLHSIDLYYKEDDILGQIIKNYQLDRSTDYPEMSSSYPQVTTVGTRNTEILSQTVPVMPDRIDSDNETVLFEYMSDRPDLRKSRLKRIKVLNRATGDVIKQIEFQHSYFGTASANNQRLRLDNLNMLDNGGNVVEKYSFGYNNTPLPPYYHSLGMSEHHNVDYWGYYNGADDPNLLPRELFDLPSSYLTAQDKAAYGGNRNPNPATAQACILTDITFPTGGKTSFEYELNHVPNGYSYTNNSAGDDFGGLRVRKITSTADGSSIAIAKTYKYSGETYTRIEPAIYQFNKSSVRFGPQALETTNHKGQILGTTMMTDPLIQLSTGNGPIVIYNKVIEYNGTETANNGYTEYNYERTSMPHFIYDPGTMGNIYLNGFYLTDFGNYNPLLASKIIYSAPQGGLVREIKREEYFYTVFNSGNFITGLKINRNNPFVKLGEYANLTDCDAICSNRPTCTAEIGWLLGQYEYSYLNGVLDVPLLTRKTETVHPSIGVGDLVATTDYIYDPITLQPIQEKVKNSKGETIISVKKYASDFVTSSPYNTMVARNILSPVIEHSVYKNTVLDGSFLKSTKTNYDYWNGATWSMSATDIIEPRTVDTRTKEQNTYETRMRYFSYDSKGNPTSLAKENDIKKTYLWGYHSIYPVAEIIGTDYNTAKQYIDQTVLDNPINDATLRSHLNNLRNIPNTMVKTFTYKPLVGVTSETDVNGRTTYYEYDSFNRLKLVRDKDLNILKRFCYNYSGQPESCSCISTVANWQNTSTALRCQLQYGQYTGYQEQEQRDMNQCSATFSQTRWIQAGYNPTVCQNACANCAFGPDKKCINNVCETGVKIYTHSDTDPQTGQFINYYHYEFSDGTWVGDFSDLGNCNFNGTICN